MRASCNRKKASAIGRLPQLLSQAEIKQANLQSLIDLQDIAPGRFVDEEGARNLRPPAAQGFEIPVTPRCSYQKHPDGIGDKDLQAVSTVQKLKAVCEGTQSGSSTNSLTLAALGSIQCFKCAQRSCRDASLLRQHGF